MPIRQLEVQFAWVFSMEVSPITSIRAVSLLNPGKEEVSVPPPFAIDPCEAAGDDTYDPDSGRSDRGLEGKEDGAAPEPEACVEEEGPSPSQAFDPDASVNLFA